MNQGSMRRWHRRGGILLAPFLLLQTVSGLILTYGVFRQITETLSEQAPAPVKTAWNVIMAKMHYGPGLIGWLYHSLIGLGLIWLIYSGIWIWVDLVRKKNQAESEQ